MKMSLIEKNEEIQQLNQVDENGDIIDRKGRLNCMSFGENILNGTVIH